MSPQTFTHLFCKNKSNPLMKCNGQCKMNEMVAEHHNESASDVLSHLQKEFFLYYETPMGYKKLNPLLVYSKKIYPQFQHSLYHFLSFNKIEKPPTSSFILS
ncbi:MAG TPA: hypothetical protein PKA54_00795 [Chitinophagaceae bacterium]|nr:hypothetical protein [Chitinophagaceae bacterium]